MKKTLLIIGIILIIIGALSTLIGALFGYVSTATLDGSSGTYHLQRTVMFIGIIVGVILLASGIACIVISRKI